MEIIQEISDEFKIKKQYIENIVKLLDEGNTIPFIARYRKELHGALDDQTLRKVEIRLEYLRNLDKKKEEVTRLIEELGKMSDEVMKALSEAKTLSELDDIYRPYRPKRRTKASIAKEMGLEPLADLIFSQESNEDPLELAKPYIDEEKGIKTSKEALDHAMDIIAENISDNASIRKRLKVVLMAHGMIVSKAAKENEDSVYDTYYDFKESLSKIAGHRILAINRGEKEGFLKVSIDFDKNRAMNIIESVVIKSNSNSNPSCELVKSAASEAYDRLIFPSIQREARNVLTDRAAEGAIKIFTTNLRQLLMQPPVKGFTVIGLDPGYRTGCKVAVVDSTGKVLDTTVIYPTHSKDQVEKSKKILEDMINKYEVDIISIGNGTASRETEAFVVEVISNKFNKKVSYVIVNEAGASVYSASKLAAQEFPDFDVTLRSAVSIARRLQDPLAELVKIDPKAIGVGQYQHDMPKKQLEESLDSVIEDCVNSVGVDLNTASPSLLERVSGINATISKNIVKYKEENGTFKSRAELKKVPKLGPKSFEQCAGFLRVAESDNILDNTAVHPESYNVAKKILEMCQYNLEDVKNKNVSSLKNKINDIGLDKISKDLDVGIETINDIIKEILMPGRDPRDELPKPLLRTDVLDIKDLKPGMKLSGTVRNVIDFGAFVDIGVHQDGLVHVSQISNKFIRHPSDVLKVGDIIDVEVVSVDIPKNKISLTMKIKSQY